MSSKKKHKQKHQKDESSDIHVEDKKYKKKKHRKDESSNINVGDKQFEKQNVDNKQKLEFVYYDPSFIQEVDVFQPPAQQSHVSQVVDDVETVEVDFEVKEQDEMQE